MNIRNLCILLAGLLVGVSQHLTAQVTGDAPASQKPEAIVNLASREGVSVVNGQWKFSNVSIVEVDHRAVGHDLKASGAPTRTHDIVPKAGGTDFDDSQWETIDPSTLEARRSDGRLAFAWYRIGVTIPATIGTFDPRGSTVIFEIVVDDYAEVWVNGQLPLVLGQAGGQLVKGFNAPNRVVLTRNAQPGQMYQLAVFAMNGPVSDPPANFIWIRSATLDFYRPNVVGSAEPVKTSIIRNDPSLDEVVPPDAKMEKLAGGFQFTEGPVWVPDGKYLLFSDPDNNTIYRWSPDGQIAVFRTKSGYAGIDIGRYHQPGSNGLALDPQGRLAINQHGNRRVVRLEKNGQLTVLADSYQRKKLNSPNDLIYRSDGTLFFTDPPFGLPKVFEDHGKELPYSGVYSLFNGKIQLVSTDLTGPNGLAFSPDERFLYVDNWDERNKVVMRYEVTADGLLKNGSRFFDMTGAPGEDALDGLKVDRKGNVYVSGPEGIWILSPEGKHLGTIIGPEHPHNFAWGDDDAQTLYLCARTGLYRIRMKVPGTGIQFSQGQPGSR